jgi:hypothetical protein
VNKLKKLFVVISLVSLIGMFFISETFLSVSVINAGSFLLPLKGIGAKKGASVYIKILFIGIISHDFLIFSAFLNVIIPEKEI